MQRRIAHRTASDHQHERRFGKRLRPPAPPPTPTTSGGRGGGAAPPPPPGAPLPLTATTTTPFTSSTATLTATVTQNNTAMPNGTAVEFVTPTLNANFTDTADNPTTI